jgi:hypothetical protein
MIRFAQLCHPIEKLSFLLRYKARVSWIAVDKFGFA